MVGWASSAKRDTGCGEYMGLVGVPTWKDGLWRLWGTTAVFWVTSLVLR